LKTEYLAEQKKQTSAQKYTVLTKEMCAECEKTNWLHVISFVLIQISATIPVIFYLYIYLHKYASHYTIKMYSAITKHDTWVKFIIDAVASQHRGN